MTYLLETVPETTTSLPLPRTVIVLAREELLELRDERVQVAVTLTSKVLIAPALSQTNSEIVPGSLPWIKQLRRCGDQRVGDVGHRQRHARDRRADVEHGRAPDHQVDLEPLTRRGRRWPPQCRSG